jgi:hypothetical protein
MTVLHRHLLGAVALGVLATTACERKPAEPASSSLTIAPPPRGASSFAPAPPPPAAAPAAPSPSTGDIGTAHPLVLQAVAADGHWAAICQARVDTNGDGKIQVSVGHHGDMYGDEMEPFFVRGDGAGKPDAFVGADGTGRHVIVARRASGQRGDLPPTLVLLDTFADRETMLPKALVDDGDSPFPMRGAVSFDRAGRRLLYSRAGAAGADEVVVRELATGDERVVSVGAGKLWRAWIDPAGEIVWADVVAADTDGNGKIELPTQGTSLSRRRCRGPITSYGVYGITGDKPVRRAVREADGWKGATDVPEALGAFGRAVIVRRADHAIVRKDGADERVLVPAACDGRVVHAVEADERLFYGCTAGAKKDADGFLRAPLMRVDAAAPAKPAGIEVQLPDRDTWHHDRGLVYASDSHVLVASTGTIGTINVGPPLAVVGDHVLFARHSIGSPGGPNVLDIATGQRIKLTIELKGYGEEAKRGDRIALELENGTSAVIDVAKIEVVGTFTGRPLALSPSGRVLVPVPDLTQKPARDRLLTGPLRWIAPKAP